MRILKIPSKTFIFGEYLALIGGPALLLAHTPYFEVKADINWLPTYHPESAIAKWSDQQTKSLEYMPIPFAHPLKLGGLGLSSAEFLAAYYLNRNSIDPWVMVDEYQSLFLIPPSGYDVLAQLIGGLTLIHRKAKLMTSQMRWPFDQTGYVIIATHKKLPTHKHVHQALLRQKAHVLLPLGQRLSQFWEQNDEMLFYQAMLDWRNQLLTLGLEDHATTQIIEQIMKIEGVLCAKGCGAMGADMIFASYDLQSPFLTKLNELSYDVIADHTGIANGIKELS